MPENHANGPAFLSVFYGTIRLHLFLEPEGLKGSGATTGCQEEVDRPEGHLHSAILDASFAEVKRLTEKR